MNLLGSHENKLSTGITFPTNEDQTASRTELNLQSANDDQENEHLTHEDFTMDNDIDKIRKSSTSKRYMNVDLRHYRKRIEKELTAKYKDKIPQFEKTRQSAYYSIRNTRGKRTPRQFEGLNEYFRTHSSSNV